MNYIKLDDALKVCSEYEEWYTDMNDQCGAVISDNIYQEILNLPSEDVAATKWIDAKENPPKEEGWYLVYTKPDKGYKSINKAEYLKGYEWNGFEPYWRGAGGHWGNVAYWMPLPEPPSQ